MKQFFTVGEAAKAANTTSETLRHYDRIGLVRPSKKDEWTGYRYYTEQDLVRIATVRALQCMELPLRQIKEVLEYDDLEKIVDFLAQAERRADEKMAALRQAKAKIQAARADYESKLTRRRTLPDGSCKTLPARVILCSDTLCAPALENLWNYLGHFYEMVPPELRTQFSFEDQAGIYTEDDQSRLFALCTRYAAIDGLRTLPAGDYLCSSCAEADRERTLAALERAARTQYGVTPAFSVQLVVVSGILHWDYELQIYLGHENRDST